MKIVDRKFIDALRDAINDGIDYDYDGQENYIEIFDVDIALASVFAVLYEHGLIALVDKDFGIKDAEIKTAQEIYDELCDKQIALFQSKTEILEQLAIRNHHIMHKIINHEYTSKPTDFGDMPIRKDNA